MTDLAAPDLTSTTPPRCPGPSVQDYLDQDSRPVPEVLRYQANDVPGDEDIPVERYISADWAAKEFDRVWRRVWQFACLARDIPRVGDHEVYEIGTESVIVVRTAPDTIRAFVNVCLHRGRKLRTSGGHVARFRCPFHGFTWQLDGTLQSVPCSWDFPLLDRDSYRLPEVAVDTWRGFVFVNLDPAAGPLADHLGTFEEYFVWPVEQRHKTLHVAKILPCNWKVAQDAFIESFHVIATHPQLLRWLADANSQYDATAGQPNWSRMITVQGAPSPHLRGRVSEQAVLEAFYESRRSAAAPGRDLRSEGAAPPAVSGTDYSNVSDCELLDAVSHLVFPNFHVWGGAKSNIVYRFRPDGLDPDSCVVEIMFLGAARGNGPAGIRWLSADEPFASIPDLGLLGPVFDQDCENLPHVQLGLKASRKPGITLSRYQESRIRHFHNALETWMET